MKKHLDRRLCQTFPGLYRDRYASEMKTCMCWGFPGSNSGEGWYRIIYRLSKKIQKHISTWPKEHQDAVVVCQVKEKFGTLRFYIDGADDTIYEYIRQAEKESARTCEECGKKGKLRSDGWIKCLCYYCDRRRILRRKKEIERYKISQIKDIGTVWNKRMDELGAERGTIRDLKNI